ncbi:hypothetical protein BATDEDRAFT_25487 [Batrachochytrium dendrobatidis JAM81]|uniref:intramembrane prenyl-peptidase Rce1 n=3 Tax=Batrachochytrium dendrobatidis TaxID=109871 RepID=F4P475_BATDJ|nr:CAAX prenyl protease [Batrachochytrium dendrobatidis JAM81]EGF79948.1 hypothetical protein BATDEDRAFT_25487 [Batrachochytrium dendrobatidis JAM81]OAJ38892.1 hypothetical protein BDEG_22789 [Batrachochytrium dendrobatidis JEL423]|eukprot:XP_006679466.1 hypothetical protein BATDEDRAFT_25487 [Batrachochytrium dendrobatidis JAM81]
MPQTSTVHGLTWLAAMSSCLFLSTLFVGSFYLFPGAISRSRNDPDVIRQRFKAVALTCAIGFVLVVGLLASARKPIEHVDPIRHTLYSIWLEVWNTFKYVGIVSHSPISSIAVSLGICGALFLGPLVLDHMEIYIQMQQALDSPDKNLITIRNWVVGPIVEEIVFRGYMVPIMLAGGFSARQTIWCLPLFFGIAHLHHAWEVIRDGGYTRRSIIHAATSSIFQLMYTMVFGWLATYLFIRTGSLYGPIATHIFCNIVGFPNLDSLVSGPLKSQVLAWGLYISGILVFYTVLTPIDGCEYLKLYFN